MNDQGEEDGQLAGWLTASGHAYRARIYYADTDFSGFVYHARYLEFLERGRSDFLRLAGIHHTALATGAMPIVWVVRRMDIEFVAPARLDDVVLVETSTEAISGARITMTQSISRGEARLILAKVEAAIVTLDGKPRRFPKEWVSTLNHR